MSKAERAIRAVQLLKPEEAAVLQDILEKVRPVDIQSMNHFLYLACRMRAKEGL